jgi:hypothetical protein
MCIGNVQCWHCPSDHQLPFHHLAHVLHMALSFHHDVLLGSTWQFMENKMDPLDIISTPLLQETDSHVLWFGAFPFLIKCCCAVVSHTCYFCSHYHHTLYLFPYNVTHLRSFTLCPVHHFHYALFVCSRCQALTCNFFRYWSIRNKTFLIPSLMCCTLFLW